MKTSQSTRISPDPTTPHLLKEDFSTMMKSCPRPWSPPEMALQSIPFHDMLSWVLPFTNPSDYYRGSRGLRHPCHRTYHWLPERIGWFNSRLLKLSGTHLSLKATNISSITRNYTICTTVLISLDKKDTKFTVYFPLLTSHVPWYEGPKKQFSNL